MSIVLQWYWNEKDEDRNNFLIPVVVPQRCCRGSALWCPPRVDPIDRLLMGWTHDNSGWGCKGLMLLLDPTMSPPSIDERSSMREAPTQKTSIVFFDHTGPTNGRHYRTRGRVVLFPTQTVVDVVVALESQILLG